MDPPYDRGCWHGVSRSLFVCYRHNRHRQKQFTSRNPSSCTRRCSIRLSSIVENSLLLPPVGVWAVLSPSLADHPLRPATDRRLGELLPHQLANRTQAIPKALESFNPKTTCGIRHHFWCLCLTLGYVPTRYSAVRRSCTLTHHSIFPVSDSSLAGEVSV